MSDPADTPAAPDERLVAMRPPLLELHRQMLEAERAEMERFQGRLTDAEFLQIATGGLRMAWLTPFSELIVALDEALEADPADEAAAVDAPAIIARTRALIAPPDPATAFGRRYLVMLQQNPAVVMAHAAVVRRVSPG